MGYMHGLLDEADYKIASISEDVENILRAIPSFIDIMIEQTMALANAAKQGQSPKRITARNVMSLIKFSQNLMQGGW